MRVKGDARVIKYVLNELFIITVNCIVDDVYRRLRRLREAGNGSIDFQTWQIFRSEQGGSRQSIGYKMCFPGDPDDVEGEHSHFLTKTLETRAGEIKDVLLKNTKQGLMIGVYGELGQTPEVKGTF